MYRYTMKTRKSTLLSGPSMSMMYKNFRDFCFCVNINFFLNFFIDVPDWSKVWVLRRLLKQLILASWLAKIMTELRDLPFVPNSVLKNSIM